MAFDLIIFDCDGTLVDTEYLHNKVISDDLTALGYPQFTVEYCLAHFTGAGMSRVVELAEREIGRPLPPTFIPNYIQGVTRRMPELLRPIADVRAVVEHCAARTKICVGSNGERQNVLQSLEVAAMADLFPPEAVFTKDMVKYGKPAPDLFLYAAAKMGVAPARTLVIEDSVTGAIAGVAAGMTVVGFTATFHDPAAQERALRTAGAHHVTTLFKDILAIVAGAVSKNAVGANSY